MSRRRLSFIRRLKKINPRTEIVLYTYTPVPMDGQLYDGAKRLGFAFPQTLEEWASPVWEQLSMRRGDGIPWVNAEVRRSVRNFERVVNAFYPTVTDPRLTQIASRRVESGERVAIRPALVRRAVRTAGAASVDSVSASGDDGILMAAPVVSAEIRTAYDIWADTYPGVAHNPLMRLEQEIVESILMTLQPSRALDVGTGSGRYLPILKRTGATRVVGVDFSMAMLRRNRDPLARPEPIEGRARSLVCADARQLPFARRAFDVVNASLTVGDVVDLHAWTRELARVLARGGHLVYSDFHPSWAQHGWKRTFRGRDGEAHELGFAAHAIDDHLAAIDAAGLRTVAIREPRFTDDEDAGVKEFRRRWRNPPVVVVFHTVKNL